MGGPEHEENRAEALVSMRRRTLELAGVDLPSFSRSLPVPSPLRQVTNGSASPESRASSLGRNGASGGVQQRTHAATILTELIESVTPPPKFTIDNPYQTEAPVKPDYKPKVTKRMTERREELARKEKEKEQAQVKEKKDYSAKSIIEATVPKVSNEILYMVLILNVIIRVRDVVDLLYLEISRRLPTEM